jgi:ElaB/YqjD/DUF883 family membrane-anchored ribosome-binding protein
MQSIATATARCGIGERPARVMQGLAMRLEQEHTMSERNPFDQSLKNSVEGIAERAGSRASDLKESMSDMARTAASAVRDRADQLPGGPKVQEFAHAAAERLSTTADYVRSHDAKHMLSDVKRVVKNNPGPSLVIAAAFGFVLGRALTRDSAR